MYRLFEVFPSTKMKFVRFKNSFPASEMSLWGPSVVPLRGWVRDACSLICRLKGPYPCPSCPCSHATGHSAFGHGKSRGSVLPTSGQLPLLRPRMPGSRGDHACLQLPEAQETGPEAAYSGNVLPYWCFFPWFHLEESPRLSILNNCLVFSVCSKAVKFQLMDATFRY